MAKVRNVPRPIAGASGQPERMRFEDDDRIIFATPHDCDWRRLETDYNGHVFQAAHDDKIKRAISHDQMKIEAGKPGFRHDRLWYSTTAMKVRLRADVSEINELSFEERQKILWKEAFILELERLERLYPKTVTRGGGPLKKAIGRIDKIIRLRDSRVADNGRRRRGGRVKIFFDPPGPKAFLWWVKLYVEADRDPLALCDRTYKSGNREERLSDEQLAFIAQYSQRYPSRTKPSVNGLREAMKSEIENVINPKREKKGLPPIAVPSYGRLKREIDEMDFFEKLAGREGVDDAMRQCLSYGDGVQDVERALQEVEIDHWTVGLRTLLTKARIWPRLNRASRRNLQKVRMVLGVAICRRTHVILGMTLSRTASVESAKRLIEMAVSDKKRFAAAANCITPYDIYGLPERFLFDGGPAFKGLLRIMIPPVAWL